MLPYGNQKVYKVVSVTIYMKIKKLKKTEIYKLNDAYWKVQLWFFSFPDEKFGLNELSDELNISKTTAKRIVNQLIEEGFLRREILGKIWRISCEKRHVFNYSRKISFNLQMIYEAEILEKIHELFPNPRAIVLFGSYRKGDDTEKSDIDIAVETSKNNEVRIFEMGILPKFGFRENVKINVYAFSRKKIDINIFANIANGIVLEGFLEVRI